MTIPVKSHFQFDTYKFTKGDGSVFKFQRVNHLSQIGSRGFCILNEPMSETKSFVLSIVSAAFLLTCSFDPGPANAEIQEVLPNQWSVSSNFRNKKARNSLSGAICAGENQSREWCLAVNDEKKYAQFFSINGFKLSPKRRIRLLPKQEGETEYDEIDAEAVAYFDGFVYIAASHGLSRKSGKLRLSQFFVFRFPVDKATGEPTFEFNKDVVAPQIERTTRLRKAIQANAILGPFAEKRLTENGVNLEGLVVNGQGMHFGFRGPSLDDKAFILTVQANQLFGSGSLNAKVTSLNMGTDRGIRDMAPTSTGMLVLAGPSPGVPGATNVFLWESSTGKLTDYGKLPIMPTRKPETIILLNETLSGQNQTFKVLILFDSEKNGRPTEFIMQIN